MSCSSSLTDHETEEQQSTASESERLPASRTKEDAIAPRRRTTPRRQNGPSAEPGVYADRSTRSLRTVHGKPSTSTHSLDTPVARPKPKRRRLDADLGFSSPGPAFMLTIDDGHVSSSGAESSGTGRSRRVRRSIVEAAQSTPASSPLPTRDVASTAMRRRSTVRLEMPEPMKSARPPTNRSSELTPSSDSEGAASESGTEDGENGNGNGTNDGGGESFANGHGPESMPADPRPKPRPSRPSITPVAALTGQRPFDEIVSTRRREMLEVAQADLEDVHDNHDMLVRELFHLVKFVTMIGYDPEVAKQDRSDVFSQFQQEHDLRFALEASTTGSSGSKGRITRRGVNARLEGLSLKRTQPSTPLAQEARSDSRGPDKSKLRRSASVALDDDKDRASTPSQKGKRRIIDPGIARLTTERQESVTHGRANELHDVAPSAKDRRPGAKRKGTSSVVYEPRERERLAHRLQPRVLPSVPPPLRALAPEHIPKPSSFQGSLIKFWETFRLVGEDDLDPTQAGKLEADELLMHLRIDQSKRGGLAWSENLGQIAQRSPHVVARARDHHDQLLEGVMSVSQQMRHSHKSRMQLAKRVSRMIAVYWDRRSGSSERERRAEERRLRALAKWTVREVAKQWRLAVNVVRARKAAAEKAEKEKLDKEQLNAILEKSTQMLQKQQEVMARAEPQSDSEQTFYSGDSLGDEDVDSDENIEEQSASSDGQRQRRLSASSSRSRSRSLEAESPDALLGGEDGEAPRSPASLSDPIEDDALRRGGKDSIATTAYLAPRSTEGGPTSNRPTFSSSDAIRPQSDSRAFLVKRETTGPLTTRRTRSRSSVSSGSLGRQVDGPDPDADDVEFNALDQGAAAEDEELERKMWEEDEDDESEDDDLAADADLPIEELLRRYGYGAPGDAAEGVGVDDEGDTEEEDDAASRTSVSERATAPDGRIRRDYRRDSSVAASPDAGAESDRETTLGTHRDSSISDEESVGSSGPLQTSIERARSRARSRTRASSALSSDHVTARSRQPFLLRGQLRPYQQIGFEWLAGLYANGVNGILADEMGLGKTIQTISLLAHLACDKGVWGPHLVVAPTSVMLNWEVEFKKFLPGFKILSYFGNQKERKEKRIGWNTENSFNVCITSYQLVLADQHIFRRKPWVYLVLDEAHHIKNFRSQRWQTLLGFNSQRRLLLTGTPLQNNLMDLWSLMYFLMPQGATDLPGGGAFANMKDFQDWFSNPLDKAIEGGHVMDEEMRSMIHKLHTVLRPYLLRRLKSEVERELPQKFEHVITCRLSKRQRFLYNDFMSRAKTRESLASGNYLSIINCLMQLRKVCNHPDLFEVRPIVTSFAMQRSVVADYEIKDLLVRRRLLQEDPLDRVDFDVTNWRITSHEEHLTPVLTRDLRRLNASKKLPFFREAIPDAVPLDTWTLDGFQKTLAQKRHRNEVEKWKHTAYVNQYRCTRRPIYGRGLISLLRTMGEPSRLLPAEVLEPDRRGFLSRCDKVGLMIKSNATRLADMQGTVDRFAFVTPRAVAVDMPRWALAGLTPATCPELLDPRFDTLHPVAVKLHIAFPDSSLLQYDCGKLQQLDLLMRRLKEGGHRILIFTQMTKVLDILESFLNYHGYRYLRLDGATKVEQRQALTEKFNRDLRISAFILSTRSGGLGINLTGADTVLFYDLDWNAAIEAQCMDRAHRIGQTRDVHIYRFVSEHTIEENMLRKANQKRRLDSVVIQEGEFNTDTLGKLGGTATAGPAGGRRIGWRDMLDDEDSIAGVKVGAADEAEREVERALAEAEDEEDREAAKVAREEMGLDDQDFDERATAAQDEAKGQISDAQRATGTTMASGVETTPGRRQAEEIEDEQDEEADDNEDEEEEGGTIDDYMLRFVDADWDHFA